MTDLELDVANSFERIFPVPTVIADWDDVRDRAGARRPGGGSRFPSRRRSRTTWPVVGLAAVAAAAALVLFWPVDRGGGSVLDRALAAVGTDPIIHVVIERPPVEVYDLQGDEFGSVPVVVEQWFEPSKGFHERTTVGSQVVGDMVLSYMPADVAGGREQYAGVATAYLRALGTDEASLGPEATVEGHRVYWIDGGRLGSVLEFETLPLGDGDFSPRGRPSSADWLWSKPSQDGLRSPAETRAALKGALWLGQQFQDLPLASIREFTRETGVPRGILPQSVRGLDLCYGTGDFCAVSVTLATSWHWLTGRGHMSPFDPPPGTLAFGDEPGVVGFVLRDGVYVTLFARDRDELIAAAKALTPIP